MHQSVGLHRDGLLHVARRVRPVRAVQQFAAEERAGKGALDTAQTHDFRVPDAHHMQGARMPGLQLERAHGVGTNVAGVLHTITRTQ